MRKMGVKTLVKEELELSGEISNEFEDIKNQKGANLSDQRAIRFSFFSCLYTANWLVTRPPG